MRKLALAFAALALLCTPAAAQTISRSQTGAVGTVVTCTDTSGASVKCVQPSVAGSVASGATDSGNPVKVGGVYNASLPTLTTGQRGDVQLTPNGQLLTAMGAVQTPADGNANGGFGLRAYASTGATGGLYALPFVFNGSTWDRSFTCASSAVVNVTAGATTQVVAISGATAVRVCSVALTMSVAGTAKFVNGTGSNCGTGTADLTGAMALGATTPLALTGPSGGSVLRAPASNALCVTAVTGNVTGWITYAQF